MGLGGQRHTQTALPQVRVPGTHSTEGCVGTTRDCLDGCGKSRPHKVLILGPSSPYFASPPPPPSIQFNLKLRSDYKLSIMFARFEDPTAVLFSKHIFWPYDAVCLSVLPSFWVSVSRLFKGTSDFTSMSLEFPLKTWTWTQYVLSKLWEGLTQPHNFTAQTT